MYCAFFRLLFHITTPTPWGEAVPANQSATLNRERDNYAFRLRDSVGAAKLPRCRKLRCVGGFLGRRVFVRKRGGKLLGRYVYDYAPSGRYAHSVYELRH